MGTAHTAVYCEPWNKGSLVRQKAPFKLEDWAPCPDADGVPGSRALVQPRYRQQLALRGCDLVGLEGKRLREREERDVIVGG